MAVTARRSGTGQIGAVRALGACVGIGCDVAAMRFHRHHAAGMR